MSPLVVFYDHTRSRTKVWCGMLAGGPEGRARGTIAKVKRYRRKQRALKTGGAERTLP
jgi:predicted RNA-binding Zn ribbon-like protein